MTEKNIKEKWLQIRIEPNLKNTFTALCGYVGSTPSDVIRRYIYQCVATDTINGIKVVKPPKTEI